MFHSATLASPLLFGNMTVTESPQKQGSVREHTTKQAMKNPTKTLMAALAVALLACTAFQTSVQAVPITGEINFSGGVTLDNSNLATATKVTAWLSPVVGFGNTGDFTAATQGSAVTFTAPWNFNTVVPITPFWTTAVGGFTFNLISSSVVMQNSTFLNVTGIGVIKKAGFTDTPGTWSFTIPTGGGGGSATFSFAASTAATPEGGTALVLLGVGLIAVEGLRRKLAKA